jgi:hypothetical protein
VGDFEACLTASYDEAAAFYLDLRACVELDGQYLAEHPGPAVRAPKTAACDRFVAACSN